MELPWIDEGERQLRLGLLWQRYAHLLERQETGRGAVWTLRRRRCGNASSRLLLTPSGFQAAGRC